MNDTTRASAVANSENRHSVSRGERNDTIRQLWRPLSHSATFLVTFILVSIALFVVLQVLLLRSQRDGGLFFAQDIDQIAFGKTFSYNYLPTIIAVLYSMAWSWADADSKRLEAFYQLSAAQGARARDCLCLEYAFEFAGTVPLKAFRKRHWPVFAGSLAMVLIFWGVTPIQAGIFAPETIYKHVPIPLQLSADHLPTDVQRTSLSSNFSYSVYATVFLNASLPAFTTRQFTLSPLRALESESNVDITETWTSQTRMFSVNLDCQKATLGFNETSSRYYYTDDAACTVPRYGPTGAEVAGEPLDFTNPGNLVKNYTSFFAGYRGLSGDFQLSSYCPGNYSNTFFASFSRARTSSDAPKTNVTAVFCRSRYFSQAVNATIQIPERRVLSLDIAGPQESLTPDILNTSAFDSAISSTGFSNDSARTDIPNNAWASPGSVINNLDINSMVNGVARLPEIIPYAIASYNKSIQIYLDPEELKNSYQSVWQIFFARYMADVLNTNYSSVIEVQGLRSFSTEAIIMVPSFTIVVEVLLIIISCLAVWLLALTLRRPRNLASDPASISSMLSLIADDAKLLSFFGNSDRLSKAAIISRAKQQRFALQTSSNCPSDPSIHLLADEGAHRDALEEINTSATDVKTKLLRPVEVHTGTGLLLTVLFVAAIIAGGILFRKSTSLDGLNLPTQNRFIRQLVESYLPTAIATLIEPCWVSINRLLCLLQPWEELRKNRPQGKQSVSLNYFDLPPQLVFLKAFKAGHFFLSAVCLMALLANVLAIAFSSLLNEKTGPHSQAWPMMQNHTTPFLGSTRPTEGGATNITTQYSLNDDFFEFSQENYLPIISNLTLSSELPPWTDGKFFYMPFDLAISVNASAPRRAVTRAFGARLECQELQPPLGSVPGNLTYNARIHLDDNSIIECGRTEGGSNTGNVLRNCTEGQSAAEWVLHMGPVNGSDSISNSVCKSFTSFGWFRAIGPDKCPATYNDLEPSKMTIIDQRILGCRSFISTAFADVIVDVSGNVQSARLVTGLDDNVATYFPDPTSSPLQTPGPWSVDTTPRTPNNLYKPIIHPHGASGRSSPWALGYGEFIAPWHTDSFSSDYANWLLSKMNTSSAFLDPNAPLPSSKTMEIQLSAMHAALFSSLLGSTRERVLTKLVTPAPLSTDPNISGATSPQIITNQTRIFVSTPMFIIATVILALYIITLAVGYIHRPGRFLPRMPTTLASTIAYLAASHAVTDFRGTAHMTNAQRDAYVDKLDRRYGYGAFIGTDGRQHVGVEYFDTGSASSGAQIQKGLRGQLHKDLPRWGGWRSWWARVKTRGARQDSFRRAVQSGAGSNRQDSGLTSLWNRILGGKGKNNKRYDISMPLQMVRS